DPVVAVDLVAELRQRAYACPLLGLLDQTVAPTDVRLRLDGVPHPDQAVDVNPRVPHVEERHVGKPLHLSSIGGRCATCRGASMPISETALARRHDHARGQTLDVPFE